MNDQNRSPSWANTKVSARLGIKYPIIQGPLGGLSSQRLAAAVSNYGGLGSFGAHGLSPSAIKDVIAEIRTMTDKPFAMNLWVSMEDEGARTSNEAEFNRSLKTIAPLIQSLEQASNAAHVQTPSPLYSRERGGERVFQAAPENEMHPLPSPLPEYRERESSFDNQARDRSLDIAMPKYAPYSPMKFEDQARVLIDAKVPAFSFIVGIPPKEILDECRAKGIVLIGTATTPDEAAALEQAGVDIIVASGFEAGGHRGSFLQSSEDSLTGTFSLVPQVADRISLPVVAAGGIADARGIVAAFALGAQGVQIGTAFLACEESGANPRHRETILTGHADKTALTRGFTGRLARGVKNKLMETMNAAGVEILPYPLQRHLMRNVSAPAEKSGHADLIPMWAGQSASLARKTKATELLDALVLDMTAMLDRGIPAKCQ